MSRHVTQFTANKWVTVYRAVRVCWPGWGLARTLWVKVGLLRCLLWARGGQWRLI